MLPYPTIEGRFRSIHAVGTWTSWQCEGRAEHNDLIPPLLVEWEKDGRDVADVSWAYAGYKFIASARARELLERIGPHFRFEPVTIKYGRLKPGQPVYESIASKHFSWPVPVKSISIDPVRNGLEELVECPCCGKLKYKFKLRGLLANRSNLNELDAFCIREIGQYSPVFVTEGYKDALTVAGLENIAFIEAGVAE
ncbi:MAG: hypothetical protein IV086_12150 [Hyphomonadaceae bacterium]|nr:hypothetical protein [Hyphomonadaceae bacterium]